MPENPSRHLTLRDIAKAAKASVATVSYALNDKPGVSPKMRERVRRVAEKLGYVPDAEMAKLMARVSTRKERSVGAVLGVLTGLGGPRPWERFPSVGAFWRGASARAAQLGYKLEEFWYDDPALNPRQLRRMLQARGIEGLLLTLSPRERLDFDFSGFAAAMSGYCVRQPELSFVLPDHFNNIHRTLEHTYALGYRRPLIALVGGAAHGTGHLVEGSYLYYCSTHPDVAQLPIHRQDTYDLDLLKADIERTRPDVVLGTQTDWGYRMRSHVPHEFGWMTLGWTPEDSQGLAGVDRRLEEQAGAVVDIVLAQLHRGELGVPPLRKEILVPGRVVDGDSLPPRKVAARA